MDYFESLQKEILARYDALRSLTQQSKIKGDYSEALIRDFIRRFISKRYEVGHGIIYDQKMQKSRECDVIIYDTQKRSPLFQSQDLVIADSRDVKIVMQVKSKIDSKTFSESLSNLRDVKKLNRQIIRWIVGFESQTLLKTLYLKAWKSRAVQFLQIFKSKCKTENVELLNSQMRFFVDLLRLYADPLSSNPTNFVIYDGERRTGPFHLHEGDDEGRIRAVISDIYEKGFWNLWESDYKAG